MGSVAHIIGWFSASLLQREESNTADGSWEPPSINPHFPDLVKPLLPIPGDLTAASAWPPTTSVLEEEMLQQQSPLSQARELEAELPEQGQVAHGEQAAGRRGGGGGGVGGMVSRARECKPDRDEKTKMEARQRLRQPAKEKGRD